MELGVIAIANSREQMAKQLAEEADQWSRTIKEIGVKVE